MPQEIAGVTLVHTLSHPERSEGSAFPQRPSMGTYHVYIMASRSRTLYVGVTNDLARRVLEHKAMRKAGFTSRYRVTRLVFFSEFEDAISAIEAEKVVKKWRREKKIALIESINPSWVDLSEGWVEEPAEVDWPVSEGNADPSLRSGRRKGALRDAFEDTPKSSRAQRGICNSPAAEHGHVLRVHHGESVARAVRGRDQ